MLFKLYKRQNYNVQYFFVTVKPLQLDDAILEFKMTNYMEKTTPYPSDDEDIETDVSGLNIAAIYLSLV